MMAVVPYFVGFLDTRAWRPEELRKAGISRTKYTLRASLTFVSAVHGPITAPEGMDTDLASIPRFAFAYIAPDDPAIEYASVIHDYLYSVCGKLPNGKILTREGCDEVLREAMKASGARWDQCALVYRAVRLGGGSHWAG